MWHSPPAIRHTRLRVRRPRIGSALHASHATKCYVFRLFREFGKPRPARSTPGEPARAADRQASASLSYLTHRQVVRNPHVERSGFLVSTSIHPRTAVGRGRHAGLLLITVLPKKVGTIPTYIVYDIVTQCFDHEPLCGAMRIPGSCEAAR